jgi:hypothetical protein
MRLLLLQPSKPLLHLRGRRLSAWATWVGPLRATLPSGTTQLVEATAAEMQLQVLLRTGVRLRASESSTACPMCPLRRAEVAEAGVVVPAGGDPRLAGALVAAGQVRLMTSSSTALPLRGARRRLRLHLLRTLRLLCGCHQRSSQSLPSSAASGSETHQSRPSGPSL